MSSKSKWLAVLGIGVIVVAGVLVRPSTSGGQIDQKGEADKPKPKNTEKATTAAEQEKELRKTLAAFSAAFTKAMQKGDIEPVMAFWTDDAEFINEQGKVTRGKEALRAILKKAVTNLKGHKHSIKVGTIRFPKPADVGSCPDLETMIHELAHVWEHQNGETQILSGAVEQLGHLLLTGYNPYDFGGPAGVHGATRLRNFNKESQAQIIENYWRSQQGFTADTGGRPFTEEYVDDLRRLVEGAGIGQRAPAGATSTVGGIIDSIAGGIVNGVLTLFRQ